MHQTSCIMFTVTNHYCLLSLGMWFLVEGIRLMMATSFPYTFQSQEPDERLKVFIVMGWIIPVFIVGSAAGVGFPLDIYMKPQPLYGECHKYASQSLPIPKYDRCWLVPGTLIFNSTVVAPLAFVLFINLIIIVKTTHVIFNSRRMRNRGENPGTEDALRSAKSFVLFFLMLGGTWILAFFTGTGNDISNTVLMYFHSLVNGLQGIVVFLLYCIMDDIIRQKLVPCTSEFKSRSGQQHNPIHPEANSGAEVVIPKRIVRNVMKQFE
uniref:Adhesion G-protein coupled receptor D1-like n=1 Tax=Phallusia mammillata TaxID=59560 RepID=A0A6F9D5Q4_9ASCI|nr:adhesion G-protein coupled receptor D1-like [Phallusia mammillata]